LYGLNRALHPETPNLGYILQDDTVSMNAENPVDSQSLDKPYEPLDIAGNLQKARELMNKDPQAAVGKIGEYLKDCRQHIGYFVEMSKHYELYEKTLKEWHQQASDLAIKQGTRKPQKIWDLTRGYSGYGRPDLTQQYPTPAPLPQMPVPHSTSQPVPQSNPGSGGTTPSYPQQ
jgi:hypothetical protein